MDILFWIHLLFVSFFISIVFWPFKYLSTAILFPIILASIWIIFDGCPLTKIQYNLNDEYFSQVLLRPFFPNITKEQTTRATYYILLLITIIIHYRLILEPISAK